MSKLRGRALVLGAIALLLALAVPSAGAREDSREANASLDGYQETPTLSTTGHGRFRARINASSTPPRFCVAAWWWIRSRAPRTRRATS